MPQYNIQNYMDGCYPHACLEDPNLTSGFQRLELLEIISDNKHLVRIILGNQ